MLYRLSAYLDSPFIIGGAVAFIVLLIVLYFVLRQPRVFRAFGSGDGEVSVTRKAVRELVRTCCEEIGDVGSARAHIHVRRGEVSVRVDLRMRRSANLKGISSYLRQQIAQALTENLGIEKLGDIEMVVVGVLEEPVVKT